MWRYASRRVLFLVPTLFLVSILVFSVMRLFPGDILDLLTADSGVTEGELNAERARIGLDKPIYQQYLLWIGNSVVGNLGRSLWSGRSVATELAQRLPVTIELGVLAVAFSLLIGIPIGILAAVRQDSVADYLSRSFAIGMLSIPGFWLATMILLALSLGPRWTPPFEYTSLLSNPWDNIRQFFLPALILGLNLSAVLMRMTRATLLEVLRQDYIRTAWAKGLNESAILLRHAVKNSLIPVVTIVGLETATVIGGSVIMETIFGLPGVGKYVYDAILTRDYPSIQAINLFLAAVIMSINLVADLSLSYLDPRIRFQ